MQKMDNEEKHQDKEQSEKPHSIKNGISPADETGMRSQELIKNEDAHLHEKENGVELEEQCANDIHIQNTDYTPPMQDPYDKAMKYLSKHNIWELLQNLTTDIALKRPENPVNFMIDEIEKLQEQDRHRKGVIKKLENPTKVGNQNRTEDTANT